MGSCLIGVFVGEIDVPPVPVEAWGAVGLTVAGWVAWMFTRADRTADRRVAALEAAVRHLTERVDVLETDREELLEERAVAEEEAHRLRLLVFRLEEYAEALLAWGTGLLRRLPEAADHPAPPAPPAAREDDGLPTD
jgi:hypothetical protein|nr:MAG TPA: hypothetical protein [Caudoviricetes sp.]